MAQIKRVSLNQPISKAKEEQLEFEKQGYVVVGSYGDDYDMGIVFEYAKGVDKHAVILRHEKCIQEHMERDLN